MSLTDMKPLTHKTLHANPAGAPHSPQRPFHYWFRASTPVGVLSLGIAPDTLLGARDAEQAPANSTLEAACTLGREETFVQWLENWLGVALDFEPGGFPASCANVVAALSPGKVLSEPAGGEIHAINPLFRQRVLLSLPVDTWRKLVEPPAELSSQVDLYWQKLPCRLILTRFELPAAQLQAIEPGGLILIPDAFQSQWRCQVKAVDQHTGFSGELDLKKSRLIFSPFAEMVTEADDDSGSEHENESLPPLEIALQQPLTIPMNCLLGWGTYTDNGRSVNGAVFPLLEQALRKHRIAITHAQQKIASGHLLSVADGFAVLIDALA